MVYNRPHTIQMLIAYKAILFNIVCQPKSPLPVFSKVMFFCLMVNDLLTTHNLIINIVVLHYSYMTN